MSKSTFKFRNPDGDIVELYEEAIEAIENDFGRPFEEIPSWEVLEWLES